MPARLRAAVLRDDLAVITGEQPTITQHGHSLRVTVAAPDCIDEATWHALLPVLRRADAWGSSDATGSLRVWAAVIEERAVTLPVDTAVIREAALRLLDEDAEPPSPEELETLTLQLRGHLMLLIPELEAVAPEDARAQAGIGEARRHLDTEPRSGLPAGIAHAQRLARSVQALLTHLERLT